MTGGLIVECIRDKALRAPMVLIPLQPGLLNISDFSHTIELLTNSSFDFVPASVFYCNVFARGNIVQLWDSVAEDFYISINDGWSS